MKLSDDEQAVDGREGKASEAMELLVRYGEALGVGG
jgi:hypothetical protein